MDSEGMLAHELSRDMTQLPKHTALNRSVEHRVFCGLDALGSPRFCFAHSMLNL